MNNLNQDHSQPSSGKPGEHQTTLSTNKELIESFVEDIFNKHDILAAEKYFVKDSTTGGEGFKQLSSALFRAFPDMHTK